MSHQMPMVTSVVSPENTGVTCAMCCVMSVRIEFEDTLHRIADMILPECNGSRLVAHGVARDILIDAGTKVQQEALCHPRWHRARSIHWMARERFSSEPSHIVRVDIVETSRSGGPSALYLNGIAQVVYSPDWIRWMAHRILSGWSDRDSYPIWSWRPALLKMYSEEGSVKIEGHDGTVIDVPVNTLWHTDPKIGLSPLVQAGVPLAVAIGNAMIVRARLGLEQEHIWWQALDHWSRTIEHALARQGDFIDELQSLGEAVRQTEALVSVMVLSADD